MHFRKPGPYGNFRQIAPSEKPEGNRCLRIMLVFKGENKMKKKAVSVLALVLALALLSGCGAPAAPERPEPAPSGPAVTVETMQTIGDAMANRDEGEEQYAAYENRFVYVFTFGGAIWRVLAPMSEEEFNALIALDIFDEQYQEAYNMLVMPLKIEKRENLSELLPDRAELDKLIGKTGAELFGDGWTSAGFNLYDMQLYADKGPFEYVVTFDGGYDNPDGVPDDFDEYEFFGPLKVKSVVYARLGNATDMA